MRNLKQTFFFFFILLFGTTLYAQSSWNVLKTGAGGWVTGMDIHPSGDPIFARVDVGSAYRWNATTEDWTNIVTSDNLPASEIYWNKYDGVLSIVSAPSDNDVAYLAYFDGIYRSTNKGDTWVKTSFPTMEMSPNDDDSKLSGERLSVDPANSSVVYFGSIDDGLWYTDDGGSSWSKITATPDGDQYRGVRQILFDKDSGTTGGKTNVIYGFIDGEGVYKTEDAGSNWNLISFGVANPWFYDAEISIDGKVYICGENSDYDAYGVYQYDGTTWTQVFSEDLSIAMGEIAVDPFDANRLFVFSYGYTDTYRTTNVNAGNPTWTYQTNNRTASGIPWLSWSYGDWFSIGEVVMDPVVQNKIWKADGVGVWVSTDVNDGDMTWDEKSVNQEHLVSNDLIALPDDKVVTVHWDRPVFHHSNLDEYPTVHQPSSRFNSSWDLDQSPSDENFLVAIIEDHRYCCYDEDTRSSGYSEDGGLTWTKFATMPDPGFENSKYGIIAVSANDNDNIIWLPVNNEMPYYTTDRGDTWTQVTLPGASGSCCLAANYFNRRALTADRVLDNTFYIYDFGNGSVFKTTNGGASWSRFVNVLPAYAYNVKLTSVPEHSNHLLFAKGPEQGVDLIGPLSRSTDGGETWTDFVNTNEVLNVTVGKKEEGMDYPTIFIYGRVNDVLGYWMTVDEGTTWTQLGDYPLGIYDSPKVMEGDMNVHGRLYIGFAGNGFVYHELDESLPVSFVEPFWGYEKDGVNLLKWTTSEEKNVSHFEIQRSSNGTFWDVLGRKDARGNTSDTSKYSFQDRQPIDGSNYYRLKTIDEDETFQYSNIVIIENVMLSNFSIIPNPVQDAFVFESTIKEGRFELLDIHGRVLQSHDIRELQHASIDVSELPKGIYLVRISDQQGKHFSKKIIKN